MTFPKPAYVYQPQALLTALAEDDPEADLLVEHLNRALSYTELKSDYDHIPDDVMQWALAQTVQVATIQAPAAPLINATIHPATLSERGLGPIPSRKLGNSGQILALNPMRLPVVRESLFVKRLAMSIPFSREIRTRIECKLEEEVRNKTRRVRGRKSLVWSSYLGAWSGSHMWVCLFQELYDRWSNSV